jgi:hypothetical protein
MKNETHKTCVVLAPWNIVNMQALMWRAIFTPQAYWGRVKRPHRTEDTCHARVWISVSRNPK